MSGKNNVNPDHYKVAGRDRPNEVLTPVPHVPADSAHLAPAKGRRAPNFIPGALPVGEAPPRPKRKRASRTTRAKKRPTAARTTGKAPTATRKRSAAGRKKRPAAKTRRKAA